MFNKPAPKPKINFYLVIVAVVVLAVVGSIAYYFLSLPQPNRSTYQAVFLVNGQVYFGRLKGINSKTPVLDDVYYLQVNQQLQPGADSAVRAATSTTGEAKQPQFSLMKLGQSEIHGPEDRLHLIKSQILFWENLRPDSQVVKTIADYKKPAR